MDGTNRTAIVTRDIYYATDVTLDYSTQKLYWIARNMTFYYFNIESANTDGSSRKTHTRVNSHVQIDFFQGSIYFTYNNRFRSFTTEDANVTQYTILSDCYGVVDFKVVSGERQTPGTIHACNAMHSHAIAHFVMK